MSPKGPPRSRLTSVYVALGTAALTPPLLAILYAMGSDEHAWADGLAWALCMISVAAISALLGLIFAVPRARAEFIPGASERYFANSNLEQISDWLTKLLVGAGLVELKDMPAHIGALGSFFAETTGGSGSAGFATVAVVYGAGLGFVAGYLWTRLKLRFLLEQSDRDAERASLEDQVARSLSLQDGGGNRSGHDLRLAASRAVLTVETASTDKWLPILWADDHPENNSAIIGALNALDIDVVTVLSSAEALERLRHGHFALVISDLGRREDGVEHEMAGLELLQAMRELPLATPVIIFAGPRGIEHRDELVEAGARLVSQKATEVFGEAVRYVTGRPV